MGIYGAVEVHMLFYLMYEGDCTSVERILQVIIVEIDKKTRKMRTEIRRSGGGGKGGRMRESWEPVDGFSKKGR